MEKAKEKQPFLERMKQKWGLSSIFQVVLILIVFALTGMTVVWIRPIIFHFLGIDHANNWIKTVSYLILIFPMYQTLLLVYGFIFGQFTFFWEKEKKLLSAVIRLFSRS